jgi:hypothetical protein
MNRYRLSDRDIIYELRRRIRDEARKQFWALDIPSEPTPETLPVVWGHDSGKKVGTARREHNKDGNVDVVVTFKDKLLDGCPTVWEKYTYAAVFKLYDQRPDLTVSHACEAHDPDGVKCTMVAKCCLRFINGCVSYCCKEHLADARRTHHCGIINL